MYTFVREIEILFIPCNCDLLHGTKSHSVYQSICDRLCINHPITAFSVITFLYCLLTQFYRILMVFF